MEKQSLPFFRACYHPEGTLIQRGCWCLSYHLVLVPLKVWELLLYLLALVLRKKNCTRKCVFLEINLRTHKTGFSKFLVSTPLPFPPLLSSSPRGYSMYNKDAPTTGSNTHLPIRELNAWTRQNLVNLCFLLLMGDLNTVDIPLWPKINKQWWMKLCR